MACLVTSRENTKAGGEIHGAGSSVRAKDIKGTCSSIVSYLLYHHTGRALPALVMGVKYVLVVITFTFLNKCADWILLSPKLTT